MCSVELPFSWIIEKAMRRSHLRSQHRRANPVPGPSEARPVSVRRALFAGPVDHAETARDLARESSELQRDASDRWNFDFETDTPLQGRFEWEVIAGDRRDLPRPTATRPDPVQRPVATRPDPVQRPVANRPDVIQRPTVRRPASRPKQRKLTEYMSQRKRSSSMLKSQQTATPVKTSKTVTAATASSPGT